MRRPCRGLACAAVLAGGVLAIPVTAQNPTRSICIAPLRADMDLSVGSPDGTVCDIGGYAIKIDNREPIQWTTSSSVRIDGLDPKIRHRVVITCARKPSQSFGFRFSEFRSQIEPCLFLNDFYKTIQLWDSKLPWCKCQ